MGVMTGHARRKRGVKAQQTRTGIVEVGIGIIDRAAIVRAQHEQTQHLGIEDPQHIADGEEIAERLRHFLVVDPHKAVVHPVANEVAAMGALALGNLVFMMGKLQVGATAVNIERLAQQGTGHRRTFDMPARPARAEIGRPGCLHRIAGLGRLPEHEVERIIFGVGYRHTLTGSQFIERLARQPAIVGKTAHRIIDVAVGRAIGQIVSLQQTDQIEHLRHVLGGTRLMVGAQHAERIEVLVHGRDEALGQLADGLFVVDRTLDDLVVDVSDVAHIGEHITARSQPA